MRVSQAVIVAVSAACLKVANRNPLEHVRERRVRSMNGATSGADWFPRPRGLRDSMK